MQTFHDAIRNALAGETGLAPGDLRLDQPRDPNLGDVAFPCFVLAKEQKQPPPKLAAELVAKLEGKIPDVSAVATGPFINFKVDRGALARSVFGEIEARDATYGGSDVGKGQRIVIDYSSPNIAKPMHVGHLRSTIIGAALKRLHDLLGYETVGINHIGDWGSQFGKLIVALDRWGESVDLEKEPIRALLALYVKYHDEEEKEAEGEGELAEAARAAFRVLESGEEGHVRDTWTRITKLSLSEFQKIYDRLGITFDLVRGEAFYEPLLDEAVDRIVGAGITEESDGALIVDLESVRKKMAPCLLRKSDGTTLYATRDLAAAFHRWENFEFARCLYVVGNDQKLHFEQLWGVLGRMDLEWVERMEHIAFGMMRLPEGKLQTRKGRVVFLEDVLDRAVDEARKIIGEKNPELAQADDVAESVGLGAVIFNDLKRDRVKDVEFVWSEVVSFEGDTGPYVQYSHARLASILRKAEAAGEGDAGPDWGALEDAGTLLVQLGRFPEIVRRAAERCEPSEVTGYLLGLSRELNSWYVDHRVLGQEPGVTSARLALVKACKCVLRNGLRILGLAAPEEM